MRGLAVILLAVAAGACATSGAVPRPFPTPGGAPVSAPGGAPVPVPADTGVPEPEAPLPSPEGYAIVGTALSLRGMPYRKAGSGPSGFDCSGLVWYVFGQHGVDVPRTVAQQYRAGTEVDGRDLRAGDLVFFNTSGVSPSHVGIWVGGDEFIHAPTAAGQVRVERLGAPYWKERFVGARRMN